MSKRKVIVPAPKPAAKPSYDPAKLHRLLAQHQDVALKLDRWRKRLKRAWNEVERLEEKQRRINKALQKLEGSDAD